MINIVYMVLGGGQFVAQTISSAINKKNQWELYEDNKLNWLHRESLFEIDPSVRSVCSHEVFFKEVMKMENLVLITCNDIKDLKMTLKRSRYIDTNMNKSYVLESRFRYHRELYNHLIDKKKDFFQLSYSDLWDIRSFMDTIKECMSFLQLPFDEEKFRDGHKKWIRSNIVHNKNMQGDKT